MTFYSTICRVVFIAACITSGNNKDSNRFRLIICKNPRGQATPSVKFSMDLGAIYKMGVNRRLTKRQQEAGYIEGRLARGSEIK